LAAAYAWEPFLVKGPEMDFVESEQATIYEGIVAGPERVKFRPSAEFLREWDDLSSQTNKESKQRQCFGVPDTKDAFARFDK